MDAKSSGTVKEVSPERPGSPGSIVPALTGTMEKLFSSGGEDPGISRRVERPTDFDRHI